MKYLKPLAGSAVLIGLMLAASVWAWPRLGDQLVAVHFGIDGRPDGFASKTVALLAMPGVAVMLSVLLGALPAAMPATARLERSWGPYVVVWTGATGMLLAIHLALIAFALGMPVSIPRVTTLGVGLLLAVMGNLLGKVRYNYVFGVRTPWTLANERVWDRTHRFAGWMTLLGGLVAVAAALATPAGAETHRFAGWGRQRRDHAASGAHGVWDNARSGGGDLLLFRQPEGWSGGRLKATYPPIGG
jgi:uncharacterized membrane protein